MAEIHHRVGIKVSAEKIYQALTTNEGLASWWTNDVTGAGKEGSVIEFRFNGGGPDFEVTKLVENETVQWKHSSSIPEEWMGSEILFQLQVKDDQTIVRFSHYNWKEATDFMAHCSTKWAVFLLSLKEALETGKGKPFPNDIGIDHS
jgi:uncharacterized protein YndB with AHSA1/START domain